MSNPPELIGQIDWFNGIGFYYQQEPPTVWSAHAHRHLELFLPLGLGSATLTWYDDDEKAQQKSMAADQICIIPPYQLHSVSWPKSGDLLLVYLPLEKLVQVAQALALPGRLEISGNYGVRDPLLTQIFLKFRRELNRTEQNDPVYLESLSHLLVAHILRHYRAVSSAIATPQSADQLPYRLQHALTYIEAHYGDNSLRVVDVAIEVGLSQYYFCHLFKQSLGLSPYQYILQERINQAKRLLQVSELSLAEIATVCGFSSQGHLTRQFHKQMGLPPKRYRLQQRKRVASEMKADACLDT